MAPKDRVNKNAEAYAASFPANVVPTPTTNGTMLDITNPTLVEIVVRADSKVVWVNVDGICRIRCCQIEHLTLDIPTEPQGD